MPAPKTRLIVALALVTVTGAAAVWLVRPRPAEVRPAPPDPVLSCELDGFRYEYHLPTGSETLFRLENGVPVLKDVLAENPEKADACRRSLQRANHVDDLSILRAQYDETMRRLHALGYL